MTSDEVYKLIENNGLTLHGDIEHFANLVAQHEREACAYWAGIALLGADRGLSNRVDQAIRARGQA
jgi:hypothetical protein